jgi:hypothetical protein
MFEIRGGIPEPIIDGLKEAGSLEKMAGLGWKSDAAATVIHRYERERAIRLNGTSGVKFQNARIENLIRAFCFETLASIGMAGMDLQHS